MICPNCNKKLKVQESRTERNVTYRRYVCDCGVKFYTEEKQNPKARMKLSKIRNTKVFDNHNPL